VRSDAGARFAAELAVLRDSVVRSIRQDNVADLKDGLELYASLVRTVLEQFRHFQVVTRADEGPGVFSYYGREMSWIEDDVRTFLANASSEPGSDATQETLGFILGLVKLALETRELPAFGAFLQYFTIAWVEGKSRTTPDSWPRLRGSLLLTLENFGDFWIGRELTRSQAGQIEALPYAHRLLGEITQLMKISVDSSSAEDLRASAQALRETLSHAIEMDEDKGRRNGMDHGRMPSLRAIKSAATLGVEAWIRLRVKHHKTEEADGRELLVALRDAAPALTWKGYEAALERDVPDLLRWTWWETGLWENRRAGALTFDSWLSETFAGALLDGRASPPAATVSVSRDLKYRIEQLRQQIEQLRETPSALGASPQSDEHVTRILVRLEEMVSDMQRAEDRELAALPLLVPRIDLFRSAVVAAWNGPRYLRQLGSIARWDPTDADRAEPTGFGINRLVPKDYFVEQPGVYADPADLGRELGDGVGRGEDALILEGLRRSVRAEATSLEDLAGAVVSAAKELTAEGLHPTVLVVNSWDVLEALRSVTDSGTRRPTADVEDSVRLQDSEVSVLLRYGGAGSYCIVADLKAAIEVTFKDPLVERAVDRLEWPLLIGVEHMDLARARELVDSDPAFRRTGSVEMSVDEAVLELQKSAHVRVLEWVSIEVRPEAAGRLFDVEDAQ
jgi:hypothetical protein